MHLSRHWLRHFSSSEDAASVQRNQLDCRSRHAADAPTQCVQALQCCFDIWTGSVEAMRSFFEMSEVPD